MMATAVAIIINGMRIGFVPLPPKAAAQKERLDDGGNVTWLWTAADSVEGPGQDRRLGLIALGSVQLHQGRLGHPGPIAYLHGLQLAVPDPALHRIEGHAELAGGLRLAVEGQGLRVFWLLLGH